MPFSVTVHHGAPILLVECAGPATLADLSGAADLVARVAAKAGYRRALIDMLAIDAALSFTEHLHLGAHVAEAMAGLERVATVVSPRIRSGTSEKAANILGLRLRTFTDLEGARAWIAAD